MEPWKKLGFGDDPVTEIVHTTVKLKDGIKLGIKAWLPCQTEHISMFSSLLDENAEKWTQTINHGTSNKSNTKYFPCILEYLPYSKDSLWTVARDHCRHPWMCSHGYVVLRVDMRGTGSSDGIYSGEHERSDGEEIINWISQQNWSNQRVGMYGKSWGGYNGLQLAYRQLSALKTAISLYSTDDRFNDDCNYRGNAMIGNGMLSWANFMLAMNARPPHPRYFKDLNSWKAFWKERLENNSKSDLLSWCSHQLADDPYWKGSSIRQDYSKIKCPILIVGGQSDLYKNAALRMAGKLNIDSKAIIGPWNHEWPDVSVCGPNIDFLQLCLEWWNHHLKETPSQFVESMPRLSVYLRESLKAKEVFGDAPGKWVKFPEWETLYSQYEKSSPNYCPNSHLKYIYFGSMMSLKFERSEFGDLVELFPHALQGAESGECFSYTYGLPGDQSVPNSCSMCWKSGKLTDQIVFAGLSKLFVCCSAKTAGKYSLQVRVCDDFPNGESTLITRGCLNLATCADGSVSTYDGEEKVFCVDLDMAGYIISPGHWLLISITPTYFPSLYLSPDNTGLFIHPEKCTYILQTTAGEESSIYKPFEEPKDLLEISCTVTSKADLQMKREVTDEGRYKFISTTSSGMKFYPTLGYECCMNTEEVYTTDEKVKYGNITGTQSIESNFNVESGKICTLVETAQEMNGDKEKLTLKEDLKVCLDGEVFFQKYWKNDVVRKYV